MDKILVPRCPICLRDRTEKLSVGWSCSQCYHQWRPQPWMDTESHFTKASYTRQGPLNVYQQKYFEELERIASSQIERKQKKMLDFGCANGDCMEIFKKNSWDVFGIEIAENSQKVLTEKQLCWASSIGKSVIPYGSLDTILLVDSMYYLDNPVLTLEELYPYLAYNGILLLRQPTRAGLVRCLFKWFGHSGLIRSLWYDHMHLFSKRSTEIALRRAGFTDIHFSRERRFRRRLRNRLLHNILYFLDSMSLGCFDLTLSWTVSAKKCQMQT